MIIFIGAIGTAITAVLTWAIATSGLILELLTLVAAGVTTVALIQKKSGKVKAKAVA